MEYEDTKQHPLIGRIKVALEEAEDLSKTHRSRELSLVITKLEEAQLWLSKIVKF